MPQNKLVRLYRRPALSGYKRDALLKTIKGEISPQIEGIETEFCFNIESSEPLLTTELDILRWLMAETFETKNFSVESFLDAYPFFATYQFIFEVGPRMNFSTAWSTNAVSICHSCGLTKIKRIERSRRYKLTFREGITDSRQFEKDFLDAIHDRMTECLYSVPIKTFETGIKPEPVRIVPLLEEGNPALMQINHEMGLGLDAWDIDYYYNLFVNEFKRNPSTVECFDLGQSNSEHSRHWFFKGRLIIDGREIPESLMHIVAEPYRRNPNNSIIAFNDNSSAIRGYKIKTIIAENPEVPSPFKEKEVTYHIIFTAETHNFPTGVAPFPGGETGTGGRIRDVHATGRGGLVVAGTAAYCVGNLFIPNYPLPWEDDSLIYPKNLAAPLQIMVEASNGASDYGNKFGEPVIQGFTRSFGLKMPRGDRREWIKPIMFTGGVGQIDSIHTEKGLPEKGMLVVKIGGPAYRIGMGGGAASSMISGENVEELDFDAVQRGDAEMEQKLNRVIRACVELGDKNPIVSIHDQGAGGNSNVVKEIINPAGAKIEIRKIIVGDTTMSALEIWGAEYQEQDAVLIHPHNIETFKGLCEREKVPVAIIGEITGDGYLTLYDRNDGSVIASLNLANVLGDMPQKSFKLERTPLYTQPLYLPDDINIMNALGRVLKLISVGSKRFLMHKVDRSVTGLIARQQCAGPLQLAVSDVAVIAQSHLGVTGAAISIGEQPIKGLINPSAMARMSVGEALTNIVWAKISSLGDIKCSANWMWAPKLSGEGARLYDAAVALRDIMSELGIAVDGGKDSLSMAARVLRPLGEAETVKSPGTLVISAYATCPDITKVITPDLKMPDRSGLIYIDLGIGRDRLGGSAIAHCYSQIGDESPDVDDVQMLKNSFNAIQGLIDKGLILSGHDRSDGGLITTLLEMAFAGNCGLDINLKPDGRDTIAALFSEELGMVIEYIRDNEQKITEALERDALPYQIIGEAKSEKKIKIAIGGIPVLDEDMRVLRSLWEETSHQIELLQVNPECAIQEKEIIYDRRGPSYQLTFTPEQTPEIILKKKAKPQVAIIREEGSNGDREMASAFYLAGFLPWDVTMTDLLNDRISLSRFSGIAVVGGYSYADVLGSAKGWAGTIRFNKKLYMDFQDFYDRSNTFSLGVCNGCQLATLLGWLPWREIPDKARPVFTHNRSGRFESRFATVKILEGPAIMLKGMEESIVGVWIAHGEGHLHFPDKKILHEVIKKDLAPIRYVDDSSKFTEEYPFNPNGSPLGIAALCTPDGRHLAMMPHPERTFLKWQWAWMPEDIKEGIKASPWLRMFQNARQWCDNTL
ncbi:MAG: phosphoribosylformylglycinamidine synthase [Thermodesulfovibrionales bacterium]|nr:phosphoribosylformylglycinamidine synthase [Thermodesulfovibrionales bacterium]